MRESSPLNDNTTKKYFFDDTAICYNALTLTGILTYVIGAISLLSIFFLVAIMDLGFENTIFLILFFMSFFILRLVFYKKALENDRKRIKCLYVLIGIFITGEILLYFASHAAILIAQIVICQIIFFLISLQYETLSRAFLVLSWEVLSFSVATIPLWLNYQQTNRDIRGIILLVILNILNVIVPTILSRTKHVPFKIMTWKVALFPFAFAMGAVLFLLLANRYEQMQLMFGRISIICFLCSGCNAILLTMSFIFISQKN